MVLPTVEVTMMQPRLGFWRVQGPFDHSIVFGVFCGSIFALTTLGLSTDSTASRRFRATLTACATIVSMSSAPIAGLTMQGVLIAWNKLLKQFPSRWKLLWAIMLAAYLVVEFGSNQTPIKFYISHFTFDAATGWQRLFIWEFGSASVLNHPLFGIGLADWARPKWLVSDSIDNFWLIIAMRNGLPALVLIFGSYLWIVLSVAFREINDEKLQRYRVAYLICMAVFFFVGTTVHFYVAPYAWFMFLLGSGVWLLDVKKGDAGAVGHLKRSRRDATSARQVGPSGDGEPQRQGRSRGRPATDVSVPARRKNGR
jgi:O-antigen ligase